MDNTGNIPPTDTGDSAPAQAAQEKALRFTGSGAEYFRIWAVNLTLTVLTLGLYGPWAKVRRLQYFYRHTELDGAVFDYVASPAAILLGRLLALVLFVLYYLAFQYSAQAGALYMLGLAGVLPCLLWQSIRFKARNTRYRGLSFGFEGSLRDAYRAYLPLILMVFSPSVVGALLVDPKSRFWVIVLSGLGLLALPLFHAMFRRYTQRNLRYGVTGFEFSGKPMNFFNEWIIGMGISLGAGLVIAAIVVLMATVLTPLISKNPLVVTLVSVAAGLVVMWLCYLFIGPYFTVAFQNLVWNKTRVGEVAFRSDLRVMRLFAVQVRNALSVILTLGFYRPFAAIRVARCRLESVTVIGAQHLGDFTVGAAQSRRGATGESAGEFFEMDVGL